jgi:hypothetical protein
MNPLHEQLLNRLEAGDIHPEEMKWFRSVSEDARVEQELAWILFSVEQLEKHRLRLVEFLRAQRAAS